MTKKVLFILPLLQFYLSLGQDIQFTQFYNAQILANPAFAGAKHNDRGMFHQRIQWPSLNTSYLSSLLSFDTYLHEYNSGIGVVAFYDQQGNGQISSLSLDAMYTYEVYLGDHLTFRPSLQLGYTNRTVDYSGLYLPEQVTSEGYTEGNSLGNTRKGFVDISSGFITYTDHLWFGGTWHHINTPNQSFTGKDSELPDRLALMGGYKIHVMKQNAQLFSGLHKEYSITPTFYYKSQGKFDQLDLGLYGNADQMILGVWYRGIPFKKYDPELHNSESIAALIGWHYHQYNITYSYDFIVSELNAVRVGGSHEINITFVNQRKYGKKKVTKRIPCPNLFMD